MPQTHAGLGVQLTVGHAEEVVRAFAVFALLRGESLEDSLHRPEPEVVKDGAKGLKLLKIDGVEPSRQTIHDMTYPHLNAYYCVIAHDTPEGSPTRILYDWLLSDDGQRLIAGEGYVAVKDVN